MTKQAYLILGTVLVLVLAGAVFVLQKQKEPAPVMPPISQPPVITPTPVVTHPTADTIKDFSQAKEDCKNEQCQKIVSEFQKFIDAPLVNTAGWNMYENEEYKFSLKYPKDWIFLDSDNPQYGKFVNKDSFILLSPESFDKYYVNPGEGLTERFPEISLSIDKDIDFAKKRYMNNLEGGFDVELFRLKFEKIDGFISNSPGLGEGDIMVSIPYKNILLEFIYDFDNTISKLKIIRTIINSLRFES